MADFGVAKLFGSPNPNPNPNLNPNPKVADFGVAKLFGSHEASAANGGHVHTGTCGTLRYMAPEVASRQPSQYDHRCDTYSFGLLLWEIKHQAMPFGQYAHAIDAMSAACRGERPLILEPPLVPHDLMGVWNQQAQGPSSLSTIQQQGFVPIIRACWSQAAALRPAMTHVVQQLLELQAVLAPKLEETSETATFLNDISLSLRNVGRHDDYDTSMDNTAKLGGQFAGPYNAEDDTTTCKLDGQFVPYLFGAEGTPATAVPYNAEEAARDTEIPYPRDLSEQPPQK